MTTFQSQEIIIEVSNQSKVDAYFETVVAEELESGIEEVASDIANFTFGRFVYSIKKMNILRSTSVDVKTDCDWPRYLPPGD